MAMETSPGVTVKLKEPEMEPDFAVMEQLPLFFAVSNPPLETLATFASDELQVAVPVRF